MWRRWLAGAGVAATLAVVLAAMTGFDGLFSDKGATPTAGRVTANEMVLALQKHDVVTATALLCSSDPSTSRLATSGLPITRAWLALDALSYAGSTRHDLVYRVEGVPQARALGVDVMARAAGGWCVLKVEFNPPGRY
jgi:hypothetical protein